MVFESVSVDHNGVKRNLCAMEECVLHHEKLDVYRAAIDFLAMAVHIASKLPRGYGAMAEQLRRASLSIPLNIAEGYGKRSLADRSRFYDIARGSAHECAALVDALRLIEVISDQERKNAKILLHRTVSMLVKMVA